MEPERKIEKLLRGIAKKRREQSGEPPGLHPANRRLLQDEVTKQFGKKEDRRSFWAFRVERLVFALSMIAILGVLAAMLLPALSNAKFKAQKLRTAKELAAAPPAPEAVSAERSPSTLAKAPADTDASAQRSLLSDNSATFREAPAAGPTQALFFAANDPAEPRVNQSIVLTNSGQALADSSLRDQPGAIESRSATPAQGGGGGRGFGGGRGGFQVPTVKFAQIAEEKAEADAKHPVLARFQLEQRADEISVVDNDGSIYRMTNLTVLNGADRLAGNSDKSPGEVARFAGASAVETQRLSVQLSGTNRTLNQSVFFRGNLLYVRTNLLMGAQTNDVARGSLIEVQPGMTLVPLGLEGTVNLGISNQFRLEARPLDETRR